MKVCFVACFLLLSVTNAVGAIDADFHQAHFNNNELITVAALANNEISSAQEKSATASEEEQLTTEGHVFGYTDGYFHASLGLSGEWTDNLYNVDEDNPDEVLVENFRYTVSPSIWFTYPRRSRPPIYIVQNNTSTGGLQYSQPALRTYNKYQVYFSGSLDFETYSENSGLDYTAGTVEGMLQYNLSPTFTLQVVDQYTRSQDMLDATDAVMESQRIYNSNLLTAYADWQFSDKFSVKLDYINYILFYDEDLNSFMDRTDNGFNLTAYYDYSSKTNFFIEYEYLLAGYDDGSNQPGNSNNYLWVGVDWQATVKTSFMLKAGYQNVDYDYQNDIDNDVIAVVDETFDNIEFADSDDSFNFEAQAVWQATPKSSLMFNASYDIEQSDSRLALNKKVLAGRFAYSYRFTNRLRGDINFMYENSDYGMYLDLPRTDDRYYLKPTLSFAFAKWLFADVYYSYDTKESTVDLLDYKTNIFGINVRGSF